MSLELPAIRRVGGCAQVEGIMGLLFIEEADVLPVRLTDCSIISGQKPIGKK